jgi:hypothetical protein
LSPLKQLFAVKNESASNADGYGFPIKFEVPVPNRNVIVPLLGTPIKKRRRSWQQGAQF